MLILKEVVFLHDFVVLNLLTCIAVTVTWTNRMKFENLHLLILQIAVVIRKRVLVQGKYYRYRKLAHNLSYSPADVELGEGIIAFDRTPALSTEV